MEPILATSQIIWLNSIKSSNSELRIRASELDNLSIIAAIEQSSGRGQGNHSWTSNPGENLTFSILLKDQSIKANELIIVTQIASLSICDYLRAKGVKARIKWPNDIWVGDKKIAGILIENKISDSTLSESIIGIGLNLNQITWPQDIPNPISLKQISGQSYDIKQELILLQKHIVARYKQLSSSREQLAKDFEQLVFKIEANNNNEVQD